jgi:hypothetical protein
MVRVPEKRWAKGVGADGKDPFTKITAQPKVSQRFICRPLPAAWAGALMKNAHFVHLNNIQKFVFFTRFGVD